MNKSKNSLRITLYSLSAAAFGSFLRWLQDQIAFDAETGLLNRSVLNYVVPLAIILVAVLFYLAVKKLRENALSLPDSIYNVFNSNSVILPALSYLAAALLMIGALLTFRELPLSGAPVLYLIISLLSVLAAIGFPITCISARRRFSPRMVSFFMSMPVLLYCVYLVTSYKTNASTPTVAAYAVEIIAICIITVAFYYNAGFAFGKPNALRSIYFSMLGVFFCFTTLPDSRMTGLDLILVGSGMMLALTNWLTVESLSAEATADKYADAAAETVISAGNTEDKPEPTKEAPAQKKSDDKAVNDILNEFKRSNE